MPLGKTKYKLLLINLLGLTFFSNAVSQSYNWTVFDFEGRPQFSVQADTLFSLSANLFCLKSGGENIVIQKDPFHPIIRGGQKQFSFLNELYFKAEDESGIKLYSIQNPLKPLPYSFNKIMLWKGVVLGMTDLKCIYNPGSEFEILADSFRVRSNRILLYRQDGIVEINDIGQTRFFKAIGTDRDLNPYSTYLRVDSIWLPVNGSGKEFKWKPDGFWWNDTTYLDSNATDVFIQTPGISRIRFADSAAVVSNVFCYIKKKGSFYLLFSNGRKFKIPKASKFVSLQDSLCAVQTKPKWLIISTSGNRYPVNKSISDLESLKDGMIMARAGKRYGFIDPMGFIRISCRYDSIYPFCNGLSAARLGPVWCFLDKDERIRIQPHYQVVHSFEKDITAVKKDGKWGLLSISGEIVQPCLVDNIQQGAFSGWKTFRSNWTGWLNNEGKILLPNRYSDIIEPCSGFLQVFRDGKTGLFTSNGTQIFPIQYQRIIIETQTKTILVR